jgi:hypothetical protein
MKRGGMRLSHVLLSALVLTMFGCAAKPPPAVLVKGSVVRGGQPLENIVIRFWPVDPALQEKIKTPEAATGSDGTFSLSCPPGKYRVTLFAAPIPGGPPPNQGGPVGPPSPSVTTTELPPQIADRGQTPLEVEIQSSGNDNVVLSVP